MTTPMHQELYFRRITFLCEQILASAHTFSASLAQLEEKFSIGLDSLQSEQGPPPPLPPLFHIIRLNKERV